jgi:hypothetical protein
MRIKRGAPLGATLLRQGSTPGATGRLQNTEKGNMIDSYSFGNISVDGKEYHSDVIIYPDRVDSSWWRKEGHRLSIEDLTDALAAKPEILIVGKGAYGCMSIPPDTRSHIESQGIQLVAENTQEACEKHNELSQTARVVTCLHLTC